jgi:hypothetical protein
MDRFADRQIAREEEQARHPQRNGTGRPARR